MVEKSKIGKENIHDLKYLQDGGNGFLACKISPKKRREVFVINELPPYHDITTELLKRS